PTQCFLFIFPLQLTCPKSKGKQIHITCAFPSRCQSTTGLSTPKNSGAKSKKKERKERKPRPTGSEFCTQGGKGCQKLCAQFNTAPAITPPCKTIPARVISRRASRGACQEPTRHASGRGRQAARTASRCRRRRPAAARTRATRGASTRPRQESP